MIGTRTLRIPLGDNEDEFIHVAGGAELTAFVLKAGLAAELDVTIHPLTGGTSTGGVAPDARYRRLHAKEHDDGRITSICRRDGIRILQAQG